MKHDVHRPAAMPISIVIPHLNQPEALERGLRALVPQLAEQDEIIIVDNGSGQLPREVCDAFPGVQLLEEAQPGPGPARNTGVAAARHDLLAFIDADCVAGEGWLDTIRARFAQPEAQILGGDVRILLVDPARPTRIEAYESVYAYRMDRYIREQGFTGTGNLAARRSVIEAVGPFAGAGVAEDRDWGQRATRAGYVITYVAEMQAFHPGRDSFAELRAKWDRHTAHDFEGAKQRRGGRAKWVAKTLAMGVSPLAEIPRVLASDRIRGPRVRLEAIACLAQIRFYRMRVMTRLLLRGGSDRLVEQWNRPDPR
ncbi:glycosyltransferase [uncultured Limimaricola sp.]|uniref:glycosyltransferase family 2 protein n=1 Tax=uncultured Limimaricola sp. TaxID=2211667 RepID=UPI0030FA4DDE